ncbi:MAG: monovalent cation/H+ antiporter subunit D [Burkholderiales bacterium]|nr:monovalent cation/H+ antiporter subunit D [Burkholderiales bacterium]
MTGDWLVVPFLLPLVAGALLLIVERYRPRWQAPFGVVATLLLLLVAWRLLQFADRDDIGVYLLGNWPAPFGIVLVVDRLAALLILLTSVVALASQVAARGIAPRGAHFQAFFQFQLAGLNGAFMTGDLFNLFVCFEVLLIASYALLLHDGGGRALRAGFHYVVINLVASTLFLVAATLLYGVTGTLNMADLAVRLAALPEANAGLAQAAAMLLLVVFGIKAALLPLGFWLPATYSAASGPVAVLFSVMTKVGVYGVLRVSMLLFGGAAGPMEGWGAPALLALGIATIAFGAIGTLAADRLSTLIGALVLVSSGTLIAAITLGTGALAGALYYLVHSTLAVALLFLLAAAIGAQRGVTADNFATAPPVAQPVTLGALFVGAAAAAAGMPPFAGFIGKVLMLEGSRGAAHAAWFWAALLAGGIVAVFALGRAGSRVFWKVRGAAVGAAMPASTAAGVGMLAAALLAWMFAAGPAVRYAGATARQLAQPGLYVDAVARKAPVPSPAGDHR